MLIAEAVKRIIASPFATVEQHGCKIGICGQAQARLKITYLVGCVRTQQYDTMIEEMCETEGASRTRDASRVARTTQGKTLGNLMAGKEYTNQILANE